MARHLFEGVDILIEGGAPLGELFALCVEAPFRLVDLRLLVTDRLGQLLEFRLLLEQPVVLGIAVLQVPFQGCVARFDSSVLGDRGRGYSVSEQGQRRDDRLRVTHGSLLIGAQSCSDQR